MVLGFLAHIGVESGIDQDHGRDAHVTKSLHEWCESRKRIKFGQAKQQWASNV
jgi:hypothetical protein